MNNSLKVFIGAVVVGVGHVYYTLLNPVCEGVGECWGAVAMGPILFDIIVIPLLLGVIGVIFSKEKRVITALTWFGIAFVTLLVINLIAAPLR